MTQRAVRHAFETGEFPYKNRLGSKAYEEEMEELNVELLKAQNWIKESSERIALVFEGRDAAGKGGTIKRFMEHLNPRGARIAALEKPSERERAQWYFQRDISTCSPGAKWCSSIAPGTSAQALSASWAFAHPTNISNS